MASNDSIYVQDTDNSINYPILEHITPPVFLDTIIMEKTIFWINQNQEIMMYNRSNEELTRLHETDGKPLSLAVDWVGRILYYSENINDTRSRVMALDLNGPDYKHYIDVILSSEYTIHNIKISPLTNSLYWLEFVDNKNRLYSSSMAIINKTEFFIGNLDDSDECNCHSFPEIGDSFSLDHSVSLNAPTLVFVDIDRQELISTDKNGCKCNVASSLMDESSVGHVQSDFMTIFWTSNEVLYCQKNTGDPSYLSKVCYFI